MSHLKRLCWVQRHGAHPQLEPWHHLLSLVSHVPMASSRWPPKLAQLVMSHCDLVRLIACVMTSQLDATLTHEPQAVVIHQQLRVCSVPKKNGATWGNPMKISGMVRDTIDIHIATSPLVYLPECEAMAKFCCTAGAISLN